MKTTHQLTSEGPAAREVISEDNVLDKSKISMAAGSSKISKHDKAKVGIEKTRMRDRRGHGDVHKAKSCSSARHLLRSL